jgi:hypothetical protein
MRTHFQVADSTHTHLSARRLLAWILVALLAVIVLAPGRARADGDPASDVLATQPLFLPQDGGLTFRQEAELDGLVGAARADGYALRVAVIASPTDLGSVTELWRQPENYAHFLGQELSLVYRGTLLVVMPDGFGLYGRASSAERAALAGPAVASGGLGARAITAVQRLAAAAGHPVQVSIGLPRRSSGGADYAALIVLAVGALLILAAWTLSLRARPLRAGREPGSGAGSEVGGSA